MKKKTMMLRLNVNVTTVAQICVTVIHVMSKVSVTVSAVVKIGIVIVAAKQLTSITDQ